MLQGSQDTYGYGSSYRMHQFESMPEFSCEKHRQEIVTNFCCIKTCLTALCPECIDDHNKLHKANSQFPEVDTLRRVKTMCCKQTNHAMEVIESELAKLQKYNNMSMEDKIAEGLRDLNTAKQQMHDEIDKYFERLEKDYAQIIRQNSGHMFNFKDLIEELQILLAELRDLDGQLNSNQLIIGIKRTCELDMRNLVISYERKVEDKLDKAINLPVDVEFSREDAEGFRRDLEKYVQLRNKAVKIDRPQGFGMDPMTRQIKLRMDETDMYFERKFKN